MFTELTGKILGLAISASIMFAGVAAVFTGISGIFAMESLISYVVSILLASSGFTATIIGGFALAIVAPKLDKF